MKVFKLNAPIVAGEPEAAGRPAEMARSTFLDATS
jgi:hypothetical protein